MIYIWIIWILLSRIIITHFLKDARKEFRYIIILHVVENSAVDRYLYVSSFLFSITIIKVLIIITMSTYVLSVNMKHVLKHCIVVYSMYIKTLRKSSSISSV